MIEMTEELWRVHDLVEQAEKGDKRAEKALAQYIGDNLLSGGELPPFVLTYIAGGFLRLAHGATWTQAFAPRGRMPKEVIAQRRAMKDMSIIFWVQRAIDENLPLVDETGEPGPAFVRVGKMLGMEPSSTRDAYYRARKRFRQSEADKALGDAVASLIFEKKMERGIR